MVPVSGEAPSLVGRSAGTEGEFWGSEESPETGLWQTAQNETYTDDPCHSPVGPSMRQVSTGVHGGWELECGVWREDLWRGLLLAVRKPEGMGGRSSTTSSAHGGSKGCQRREAPFLSDTQTEGSPLQPLSSRPSPCLHRH